MVVKFFEDNKAIITDKGRKKGKWLSTLKLIVAIIRVVIDLYGIIKGFF